MDDVVDVDRLIDALIEREGGLCRTIPPTRAGRPVSGSPRRWPARMAMPGRCASCRASEAAAIYRRLYWLRPRFDEIAKRSARLAAELFDTGVNMGRRSPSPSSSAR